MMSNKIQPYFRKIDRREHLEEVEKLLGAPKITVGIDNDHEGQKRLSNIKVATINTCGSKSVIRKINNRDVRIDKAREIENMVQKEKIDAILTQELRSGSWEKQFRSKPRIYESQSMNVKNQGGRASVVIFNNEWEISENIFKGRDVVAIKIKKPSEILLISVYIHPANFPRAQRSLQEIKKIIESCDGGYNLIIGGDFNSVETSQPHDVQPPGNDKYERLREKINIMKVSHNLMDPLSIIRKRSPEEYITRWDPVRPGKGRRLDKFYLSAAIIAEKEVDVVNYPFWSVSDHYPVI